MGGKFSLDDLLKRRLLIVSGKGGCGKTTVSLSLGLLAAQREKKTLIIEVNSEEQISHLLERPPIGFRQTELVAGLQGLWGINIDPKKCFEEYVLHQIKFRKLYHAVFENRYVRHFIDATPGLSDLMSIGKIYELTKSYDLVIVDTPATGHGIALLEIPSVVSRAVRVGPLRTEAEKVNLFLHDTSKTEVVLVTLPEEMPVAEALEMNGSLKNRLQLPLGPVFLNQFHNENFTSSEKKELQKLLKTKGGAIQILLSQTERSEEYRDRLEEEIPDRPILPIPFIFSTHFGLSEIQSIAAAIESGGSS